MIKSWKENYSKSKEGKNYIGIFSSTIDGIPVKAHIYVTCPMNEFGNKRIMFAKLYFKASPEMIERIFHEASDDCFQLAKKYVNENNIFKTAFCEYYSVKQFPNQVPFTFGDYSEL